VGFGMSEYLSRGLDQRVGDLQTANGATLDGVVRQAAAAGRLASGYTLGQFRDQSISDFEKAYLDTQQFAFNLTESNDGKVVAALRDCATKMIDAIMERHRTLK
jgi:hypothetical protein